MSPLRPLVNLPRLDDMVSFEEYKILNNINPAIKKSSIIQNQFYSEFSSSKSLTIIPEAKQQKQPAVVIELPIKLKSDNCKNTTQNSHTPQKIICKSKERPPPPKLLRFSDDLKKAVIEENSETKSEPIQVSISSNSKSDSDPISVPLCSIILKSPPPITIDSITNHQITRRPPASIKNQKNRHSVMYDFPVVEQSKKQVNRRSLCIEPSVIEQARSFPNFIENTLFPANYTNYKKEPLVKALPFIARNQTPVTFNRKNQIPPQPFIPVNSGHSLASKSDQKKKNIIEHYGTKTEADSINKLDQNHMEFLKQTKYMSYLRLIYPKLSINLNENLKNLYFFGAKDQVMGAKKKIMNDLTEFKRTEFVLEQNELADFLHRPEVRRKLLRFIKANLKSDKKDSQFNFCTFEIKYPQLVNKENFSNSKNKCSLAVCTNLDEFEKVLFKHVKEEIIVNYKIEIPESNLLVIESIRKQDQKWTDLFMKFSKSLDFCLESYKEKVNVLKELKVNTIKMNPTKWFIKLTGFKEEMEKFKIDFKKCFIES